MSFVSRILIKHFYDHKNKFTHRYIYRRLIFQPSRNNVIDTLRDVWVEAAGQNVLFMFGDIDNKRARCWDDISTILGIGVKFNKTIHVLSFRTSSLFWFSTACIFWAQQLSHWELVRDEHEIRSSYHICILPKLLGLKIQFVQRRGNRYNLIRLLFEDTIKRY